ncbi:protein FAM185A [Chrysoperla carnea]|uniref:protein FAM185A n=1 Tax=Chrysoperla carnea TaxID=189513 RepID=UPI001D08B9B0|nr:protein FAM185A [Chrysoperla carnea]
MLFSKIPILIRLQTSLRKFSQKIIDYNYTVEQFPKIYINSPFSINIQPVDCHNNFNNNELKIKLINNSNSNASVSCHISDNRVTIVGEITNDDDFQNYEELQCFIEAPIQSDIFGTFRNNSYCKLKNLSNDNIEIKSDNGKIILDNIKSGNVIVESGGGSITGSGLLQADNIRLQTECTGDIKIKKIISNALDIRSEDGEIHTDSCYSKNSLIQTQDGKIEMNNVHGNCKIVGNDLLGLFISGFDGALKTEIKSSNDTNINISQIVADSYVEIHQSNKKPIKFSVSKHVQENCDLYVKASKLKNNLEDIQLCSNEHNISVFKTNIRQQNKHQLIVTCPNAEVHLTELSWAEQFFKNKNYIE